MLVWTVARLFWYSTSRSDQGHFNVIPRSNHMQIKKKYHMLYCLLHYTEYLNVRHMQIKKKYHMLYCLLHYTEYLNVSH